MLTPSPVNEPLGKYLRQLREAARGKNGEKITQTELARRLGFSKSHISNVEKGVENPSVMLLKGYEAAFDIPENELVTLWTERYGDIRQGYARLPMSRSRITTLAITVPTSSTNAAGAAETQARHYLETIDTNDYYAVMDIFNRIEGKTIRDEMLSRSNSIFWELCSYIVDRTVIESLSSGYLSRDEVRLANRSCVIGILESLPDYYGQSTFIAWLLLLIQREILATHRQTLIIDSTIEKLSTLHKKSPEDAAQLIQAFSSSQPDPERAQNARDALELVLRFPIDWAKCLANNVRLTLVNMREFVEQFAPILNNFIATQAHSGFVT